MSPGLQILILFTALSAPADGPAEQWPTAGVAEFTAAYPAWDGPRFRAAADHGAKDGFQRVNERK